MPYYRPNQSNYKKYNLNGIGLARAEAGFNAQIFLQKDSFLFIGGSNGNIPLLRFDSNFSQLEIPSPNIAANQRKFFEGANGRIFLILSNQLWYSDNDGINWTQSLGIVGANNLVGDTNKRGTVLVGHINTTTRFVSNNNGANFIATTAATSNQRDSLNSISYSANTDEFLCLQNTHVQTSQDGTIFSTFIINVLYPSFGNPQAIAHYNGRYYLMAATTGRIIFGNSVASLTNDLNYQHSSASQSSGNFAIGELGLYWVIRSNNNNGLYLLENNTSVPTPINFPPFVNLSTIGSVGIYNDYPIIGNSSAIYLPLRGAFF